MSHDAFSVSEETAAEILGVTIVAAVSWQPDKAVPTNFISKGEVGLTGFYDLGRVWYKDESSSNWHDGYGAGLWISFFNSFVINIQQEFSKEDRLLSFGIGFLY